jgi:type I restriction enzyme S subunit
MSKHGDLPLYNEAKITSIGAICDEFGGDVQTGPFGSQLHASDYSKEGVPVVMPQDMSDGRIVCDRIARVGQVHVRNLSKHILRKGDLVFSRRGDVTRFAVVTSSEEGWLCGTGSIRIRLNSPIVFVGYARRYLQQKSVGAWLLHESKGITMPNLNTKIIRELPFVIPPLPEQHRIATILDQVDELRVKRREALTQLGSLTQSIFVEMFGNPVENPRDFVVKKLIDIVDSSRPITYGILMPGTNVEDGVKYVRVVDMKNGGIELADIRKTTPEISNRYRRSILKPGDLLMSIRGHVGRLALVPVELDGANITQDTVRFAITGASAIYIREYLRSQGAQRWMERHTKGIAVRGINLGDLKLMPVALPPEHQQKKFSERASAIEKLIVAARKSLSELNILFSSLQHRAFTGEL